MLCLSIACASSTPVTGGAESPAASKPVCPPDREVGADWKTISDETGAYELRVPSSLQRAPRDAYFFLHGGEVWEDSRMKVSLAFGHWAEFSFQEEVGERCRVALDGESVFLIVGKNAVIAWYERQSGSHEPVVRASSESARVEELAGIALSLVYSSRSDRLHER